MVMNTIYGKVAQSWFWVPNISTKANSGSGHMSACMVASWLSTYNKASMEL